MGDLSNSLADLFFDQHIMVKHDWIESVVGYLQKFNRIAPNSKNETIFNSVFEQWLFSDLKESSYSGFEQCGLSSDAVKQTLTVPIVVQIVSISDVGSSFHSQYKKLTYEFHDDTGFEALPEMNDQADTWAKPKRMLRMELSDGVSMFKACETQYIPSLSLLTTPGCKILLVPPMLCRRGIFMLTKNNVHVLGGEVNHLFETGRPVQVMARALGYAPTVASSTTNQPVLNRHATAPNRNHAAADRNPPYTTDQSVPERRITAPLGSTATMQRNQISIADQSTSSRRITVPPRSPLVAVEQNPTFTRKAYSDPFSDEEEVSPSFPPLTDLQNRSSLRSPIRAQNNPKGMLASSTSRSPMRKIVLEDTPPSYEEFVNNFSPSDYAPGNSLPIPPDPFPHSESPLPRKRPSSLLRQNDKENDVLSSREPCSMTELSKSLQETFTPKTSSPDASLVRSPPKKRISMQRLIKSEVIVLSDDEDVKPSTSTFLNSMVRDEMETDDVSEADPFKPTSAECSKYASLMRSKNVQKISFILQKMRFMLGSQRYYVQAVMTKVIEPLRVVDNIWTQKVEVMDDSACIECFIDNGTIVSVLGLTVSEAVAIRSSSDKEKRKEGTRRIKATEKQFHRLDLVYEIEFFSDGDTTPVIRAISTMASFLNVL